ncbi:hypothetical protein D3C74_308800 [compost metagenome]
MGRDLLDAVGRGVRDGDPALGRGGDVDHVVADAHAADEADALDLVEDSGGQGRPLDDQGGRGRACGRGVADEVDDGVLGPGRPAHDTEAGGRDGVFAGGAREVAVGDDDGVGVHERKCYSI